jgi:hypothetical protein
MVEAGFVEHFLVIFRPFPEGLAASPVDVDKATQLAELLRELRDFR